ncbi:type II toxin-antitoxin system PemK/MazF family toxin [uncultured Pseudomonas sp.]|uniref:type II toxin-antitoxin system PemK/MazF family toxin n=1 Tax=uncultured Pseudomonas sp. TaxID=114707 RepID=UPI0025CF292F|nr:type II toxin-antitoxin system PemK/MazF family toxin [uncultured Pseudomonas sp.]
MTNIQTRLNANNVGTLKPGDIIKLELDPTVGHEQQKHRPCIVLSVQRWNSVIRGFVFVAPLTGAMHPNPNTPYPRLTEAQNNCGAYGTVLLDQIRSIDALGRNGTIIGEVTDPQLMDDIRMSICAIIGVDGNFFQVEE